MKQNMLFQHFLIDCNNLKRFWRILQDFTNYFCMKFSKTRIFTQRNFAFAALVRSVLSWCLPCFLLSFYRTHLAPLLYLSFSFWNRDFFKDNYFGFNSTAFSSECYNRVVERSNYAIYTVNSLYRRYIEREKCRKSKDVKLRCPRSSGGLRMT